MKENIWPNNTNCAITLSFDDCYTETVNNVLPLMERYGIKATFNVITDYIGKNFEDMQLANLESMTHIFSQGHEIASHSCTHNPLDVNIKSKILRFTKGVYGATDKINFLLRSTKFIRQNSQSSVHKCVDIRRFEDDALLSKEKIEEILKTECLSFVYPTGAYTRRSKDILLSLGYSSARSSDIGFNNIRKIDRYALKVQTWDKSTTAKDANRWVDIAKKNGYWLIECIHFVGKEENSVDYQYFINLKELEEHIGYVIDNNCFIDTQENIMNYIEKRDCIEINVENGRESVINIIKDRSL